MSALLRVSACRGEGALPGLSRAADTCSQVPSNPGSEPLILLTRCAGIQIEQGQRQTSCSILSGLLAWRMVTRPHTQESQVLLFVSHRYVTYQTLSLCLEPTLLTHLPHKFTSFRLRSSPPQHDNPGCHHRGRDEQIHSSFWLLQPTAIGLWVRLSPSLTMFPQYLLDRVGGE